MTMRTLDVAAIVLAAGRASRFSGGAEGRTKLVETVDGKPLVRLAAEAALGSGARPVVVVTGHARDAVMSALDGLDVSEAPNPRYAEGIASSVAAGVAALPAECAGALILLADMPRVDAALCGTLADVFLAMADVDAIVPVVDGRRGNPALLSRRLFADAMRLTGDEGARKLLAKPGLKVVEVEVAGSSAGLDIDTPEALAALRASKE
ncbi:MAG: nucleotidyltransferase family protein [Beijerinckiaceae bacterium]